MWWRADLQCIFQSKLKTFESNSRTFVLFRHTSWSGGDQGEMDLEGQRLPKHLKREDQKMKVVSLRGAGGLAPISLSQSSGSADELIIHLTASLSSGVSNTILSLHKRCGLFVSSTLTNQVPEWMALRGFPIEEGAILSEREWSVRFEVVGWVIANSLSWF